MRMKFTHDDIDTLRRKLLGEIVKLKRVGEFPWVYHTHYTIEGETTLCFILRHVEFDDIPKRWKMGISRMRIFGFKVERDVLERVRDDIALEILLRSLLLQGQRRARYVDVRRRRDDTNDVERGVS